MNVDKQSRTHNDLGSMNDRSFSKYKPMATTKHDHTNELVITGSKIDRSILMGVKNSKFTNQVIKGMDFDHYTATATQKVSIYFIFEDRVNKIKRDTLKSYQ